MFATLAFCALLFPGVGALAQPAIIQQPTNQLVVSGATATFSVAVTGAGPFTYQWQHDGTNLPSGTIATVAGNGTVGYAGDGGPATNGELASPAGVAVDGAGDLFIADFWNSLIRKVSADGTITTVAGLVTNGSVSWGYSGDGGAATDAQLDAPSAVAVDGAGNLFIADSANYCIRRVDTNGIITTTAGNGTNGYSGDGGAATNAELALPTGVAVDTSGNIFIVDEDSGVIRKVDANGVITTVAGNGSWGYSGDGGAATNAQLNAPLGAAVDNVGDLFIADSANCCVRKVDTNGIITTVAGNGTNGYSGDGGAATNAMLALPAGVTVDDAGNLFIADAGTNRVRKVDADGTITTVAGTGTAGYSGDGDTATGAQLNVPSGVALDAGGNLFIADESNNVVRKVIPFLGPVFTLQNVSSADAGDYQVVVTGAGGSVTSSVAVLSVSASPLIYQISQNAAGGFTLDFGSRPGSASVVLCTADLTPPVVWQPIYTNSSGGVWQFTDTNTSGVGARFYWLSTP